MQADNHGEIENEEIIDLEDKPLDRFEEVKLDLPPEIGYRPRKVPIRNEAVMQAVQSRTIRNEKLLRCDKFNRGEDGPILRTFKENTIKEQLMLRHVEMYAAQFSIVYSSKRRLFLNPPNECNIKKFICTTIRPTKLPYLELYDYEKCATYVSNFIIYEPLSDPVDYPYIICSPSNVLKWQKGDCFDLSILLVSLLIGVGYDAYVVIGYAPLEITLKIEAFMENPYSLEGIVIEKTEQEKRQEEDAKKRANAYYKVREPNPVSLWDQTEEEKSKNAEKYKIQKQNPKNDATPDLFGPDKYFGKRLHAFVLVKKGRRDIKDNLFIEPSTGRTWLVNDPNSPYTRIDSLFNNKNFWINLKQDSPIDKIKFEYMDRGDSDEWEYVTLDTLVMDDKGSADADDDEPIENEAEEEEEEENLTDRIIGKNANDSKLKQIDEEIKRIRQQLDMPSPWPPKLYIDKSEFLRGSLFGHITRFYLKSKVDTFADYSQIDGLVKRITIYKDYQRTLVKEVRNLFAHRRDNLFLRVHYPFKFKTIEYYSPNNKPIKDNKQKWPNWRKIEEIDRKLKIIDFYPLRNEDGLIRRIEINGEKTIEHYQNRKDRCIQRSVRFKFLDRKATLDENCFEDAMTGKECLILKLTQKFGKSEAIPPNEQISKMVVDMAKNRIIIQYHMNEGQIVSPPKVISRQGGGGIGFADTVAEKREEKHEDQKKMLQIYNLEREALSDIKSLTNKINKEFTKNKFGIEEGINTFHSTKNYEGALNEKDGVLVKSLYDRARDKTKGEENQNKEEGEGQNKFDNDIVYPYLVEKNLVGKPVDPQTAGEIKKKIIDKFTERVVARADIIAERIKAERAELDKLNKEYQKKGGDTISHANEKNFDEEIHKKKFRHGILDQRLTRFEKMVAKKFKELATTLENHPALQSLKNQKQDFS